MLKTLTCSLTLLAALGATAHADGGKNLDAHVDKVFSRLDADKDGYVTRPELRAAIGKLKEKHKDKDRQK